MRIIHRIFGIAFLLFSINVTGSPITPEDQEPRDPLIHGRDTSEKIPDDTYKRYVDKSCSVDQVLAERVGWAEAGILANALCKCYLCITHNVALRRLTRI